MKMISKRMLVVINKLSIHLTGGTYYPHNNIRHGMNLAFVDLIINNELFGEQLFPDIFHLGGAYLFYTIKDHVFFDGNKRTALAAAITFLEWNGREFKPIDEDAVFNFVMDVAGGDNNSQVSIPAIAYWLRRMCV